MSRQSPFFLLSSTIIYFFDRFYYFQFHRLISLIWYLEALMRGVRLSSGIFYGRPILQIHPRAKVQIGTSFSFISLSKRCSSGSLYSPVRICARSSSSTIKIGDYVGLNGTSIVSRSCSIYIGNNTLIAPNCVIMDSPFHRLWPKNDRINYSSSDLDKDVFIGNDCWIGTGAIILPGAYIRDGSVVAARTVVRGSYPPNSLIAGVPSSLIRNLPDEKI